MLMQTNSILDLVLSLWPLLWYGSIAIGGIILMVCGIILMLDPHGFLRMVASVRLPWLTRPARWIQDWIRRNESALVPDARAEADVTRK